MNEQSTPWWRDRTKLPFAVFLAIGGFFLWTEHQAHVIEFLPWVLVLGCIGMHLFMHASHGHGAEDEYGGRHERDGDRGGEGVSDNDAGNRR